MTSSSENGVRLRRRSAADGTKCFCHLHISPSSMKAHKFSRFSAGRTFQWILYSCTELNLLPLCDVWGKWGTKVGSVLISWVTAGTQPAHVQKHRNRSEMEWARFCRNCRSEVHGRLQSWFWDAETEGFLREFSVGRPVLRCWADAALGAKTNCCSVRRRLARGSCDPLLQPGCCLVPGQHMLTAAAKNMRMRSTLEVSLSL